MKHFERARERARRRKSPWNLLLIPSTILGVGVATWALVLLFEAVHARLQEVQRLSTAEGAAPVLVALSALLAGVPLGFVGGNGIAWLVRPARRALEREAESVPGASFHDTQVRLLRIAALTGLAGGLLGVAGAALPWTTR